MARFEQRVGTRFIAALEVAQMDDEGGVFGVDGGTPILTPGQSAILAMGRVLDRPWVVDGQVVVRPVMQVSLSFDHRVIDGALGSRALQSVAQFLSDPTMALVLDREREPR